MRPQTGSPTLWLVIDPAGLSASHREHLGRVSSRPAGTRRCPWCCPRRAGRRRDGGGARAPANGGGSARGAGGGGPGAGRTRLRAKLGVHRRSAGGWSSVLLLLQQPRRPPHSTQIPTPAPSAPPSRTPTQALIPGPADHAPGTPRKTGLGEEQAKTRLPSRGPTRLPFFRPAPCPVSLSGVSLLGHGARAARRAAERVGRSGR